MFLEPTEAWQPLSLCTASVVAFLLAVHFTKLKAKVPLFYSWIGAIAIFGGALAFLLPIALNSGFGKDDDGRVLRQLILYTTGGVLGVITLGENHRKNNQEKEKNENDHTRQVYAERRNRYTKAVEQLADEKATVRLGGIYTLVGLVDEWLADDTLVAEEQQKEGQVIINNLCSYIRSPFALASKTNTLQSDTAPSDYAGDFIADQAALHEEQDVRRAIFNEMSNRSSIVTKVARNKVSIASGAWTYFEFDFSRAPIFYPLNDLTIEKANFSSCRFYGEASFLNTVFTQEANFRRAVFTQNADFSRTRFTHNADFSRTTFAQNARFWNATFAQNTIFNWVTFTQDITFSEATFFQNSTFSWANFIQNASFSEAIFTQEADFSWAIFAKNADFNRVTFTQDADFSRVRFTQDADFNEAFFNQDADFWRATFTKNADFWRATFTKNASFSRVIFTKNANFSEVAFTQKAIFIGVIFTKNADFHATCFESIEPSFTRRNSIGKFSVLADPRDYVFKVHPDSHQLINTEQITVADGRVFTIPVGCELFDPEPLPAPNLDENIG